MQAVSIFLSTVSAEFRSYRDALRHDLERHNVAVKVQEDLIATGGETLDRLDQYIAGCDAVIHLVGDMTGALALIRQRYPVLARRLPVLTPFLEAGAPALYHGKTLLIAVPEEGAQHDAGDRRDEAQRAAQQTHLARLAEVERYPEIRFANADRLAVELLRSQLHEILAGAGVQMWPANLPFGSLGELFKGRDAAIDEFSASLGSVPVRATATVGASSTASARRVSRSNTPGGTPTTTARCSSSAPIRRRRCSATSPHCAAPPSSTCPSSTRPTKAASATRC